MLLAAPGDGAAVEQENVLADGSTCVETGGPIRVAEAKEDVGQRSGGARVCGAEIDSAAG